MLIEERAAGDVTILDLKGKMTLGEGDEILKDKVNSLAMQGKKADRAEPAGRPVYRQRGPRRDRSNLHDGEPAGREPEAPWPDQAHHRLALHYEAVDGVRDLRKRSRRRPELSLLCQRLTAAL